MTPARILDRAMKTARKPTVCQAAGRPDLLCIKGRILQRKDGNLLFWATCPMCTKVTGGIK